MTDITKKFTTRVDIHFYDPEGAWLHSSQQKLAPDLNLYPVTVGTSLQVTDDTGSFRGTVSGILNHITFGSGGMGAASSITCLDSSKK